MSAIDRTVLYYTFGNHMHWVDMEWLWGYQVLPNSVRDMIAYCEATGAKGNINFEGIGYEKMAVEAPDALRELRESVERGQIEIVGASYGQPYGLFHGSESNVRQRIYGVRSVLRLLGVRPRTFWEEEFDFFPQLPQMLKGVGFRYASLFFQWTWHTPEIPREEIPAIWWEGMDGSRLLTATRNALNLHQWPEDFALLLASDELRQMPAPGIVQWLELMPSPDWMCRSEIMLPQLQQLIGNPRFDLRFVTLSEYLEVAKDHAEPRRYTLDDVFHGMSLGKNGDLFRRLSRRAEQSALAAESLSALTGLFGRPYPHWDVYPTWELEEAWRELLSAQHHDNDECEGLCGFVGKYSYERSLSLTQGVIERGMKLLADRAAGAPNRLVVFNPLGWSRGAVVQDPVTLEQIKIDSIPPFGYRVIEGQARNERLTRALVEQDEQTVTLKRGSLSVTVNRHSGLITELTAESFPDGMFDGKHTLGQLTMVRGDQRNDFPGAAVRVVETSGAPVIEIERSGHSAVVLLTVSLAPELDAFDITYRASDLPRPDGGISAALKTALAFPHDRLLHDHPYGVSEIRAEGKTYRRKYPTGEWMTSPQWFEEVHNPFTALQLLDFASDERGILYLHDGSQAFQRDGDTVWNILTMYDPWDEDYFVSHLDARFRLVPHGKSTNAERWRWAQEFTRPVLVGTSEKPGGDLPAQLSGVWCDAPNVAVTAFYRETGESGAKLESYAGRGMGFPYVLRLVEFNGEPVTARVKLPGQIASAYRTNLLGEVESALGVQPSQAPDLLPGQWNEIAVKIAPHEIVTLYLDLVLGRKQPRNLDEYRHIWATIHRVEDNE